MALSVEIRQDFESAAAYLSRLYGLGQSFSGYNRDDWVHLKNKEDFARIEELGNRYRWPFSSLYGDGRDLAFAMSQVLCEFNDVGTYPTMTRYVAVLEAYTNELPKLRTQGAELRGLVQELADEQTSAPWAVRRMITCFFQQIEWLEVVQATVQLLKQTSIYRLENGEIQMSDLNKSTTTVNNTFGTVHGRVNVNSTDNSTNFHISTSQVFNSIRDALNSQTQTQTSLTQPERETLLSHVDAMEADVGTPSFTKRYQDFIAAGANHMTLLTPFIPALSSLLGS
ncbi:UNVERIFIED_ORG: hypothetical protein J2W38_006757 [Variovorax paradoxus]|nr:hypothetical protein [Variovorax paradoxus]